MTRFEIRAELMHRIGAPEYNEPANTPIGRFMRDGDVALADLADDLDKTAGCADLAAAVRLIA